MTSATKARHDLYLCESGEELERALRERGIDLDAELERHNIPTGGAGVLATGSIAEGLGSHSSDVDIMVLTEAPPTGGADGLKISPKHATEFLTYHDGVEVNFEVVDRRSMGHAVSAFVQMAPALYDPSKLTTVPVLSLREGRILHRIRTGWPLRGHGVVEIWRDEFFTELLPTYLTISRFIRYREMFEDTMAEVDDEDGTFELMLRETASALLSCFLSIRGETNQTPKWLARCAGRLTGADAAVVERIMPLVFPPFRQSKQARLRALEQTQQFGDYLLDLLRADPELSRATGYLLSNVHYVA